MYIVETPERLFVSRLTSKSLREFKFVGDHRESYSWVQNPKEIRKIWKVVQVITNKISNGSSFENRISQIERSIQLLQNK